ncbi:MAG: PAS domain S-box protein [Pseudomonadota bacterium]
MLLLAALWAGLVYQLANERRLELRQASRTVEDLSRVYAEQILGTMRAIDQILLLLKKEQEHGRARLDAYDALAENVLLGTAINVRLADAEGYAVISPLMFEFVGDQQFFLAHVSHDDDRMFIGRPIYAGLTDIPQIDFSRRLNRPDGSFGGVVVISFNPQILTPSPATMGADEHLILGVVGLDGIIRAASQALPAAFGRAGEMLQAPALLAAVASMKQGTISGESPTDGVSRIGAWRAFDNYPLFVAAALDRVYVLEGFQAHAVALVSATAVISLLFVLGGLLLLRAIEKRSALEISIEQSREQLLEAQRLGKIGHLVSDFVRGTVRYSGQCFEMLGIPPQDEVPIEQARAQLHPDDRAAYEEKIFSASDFIMDGRIIRPDGELRWLHLEATPRLDETGRVVGFFGIMQDITARKRAEETVREQARRLRAILDHAPVAIFLKDREGRFLMANRQYELWSGQSSAQLVGRTHAEMAPEFAAASLAEDREVLEQRRIVRVERQPRVPKPDLAYIELLKFPIFDDDGTAVGISGFIFNVTDRQRMESKLRQAAKMEAIGRLAGGIAHDFNNMIGAIVGFNSFLMEDLTASTPQHQFTVRIAQICEHAKEVVHQVLDFSRAEEVERELLELGAAIEADRTLIEGALPSSTRLVLEPPSASLPVLINKGQLYQVLLNLCKNASDAMGGQPGTIAIRLERVGPDHSDRQAFAGIARESGIAQASDGNLEPDRVYSMVRVSDTGSGMDQATLDRVFEPFFTTKRRGVGTGLGLAVIHGIIASSGGAYRVISRLGLGSEFSIYLPLAPRSAQLSPVTAPMLAREGEESLLIVDDDENMAATLSTGLERLGYDVTCSSDPLEALKAFKDDPTAWDLVIADEMMPPMRGSAFARRIKLIRPTCPVILCTGLAGGTGVPADNPGAGADIVLAKPLQPGQVAELVRRLLDDEAATPSTRYAPTP